MITLKRRFFLLSILLTAVFLFGLFSMRVFASEVGGKDGKEENPVSIEVLKIEQIEGELQIELKQEGYKENEPLVFKLYLKEKDGNEGYKKHYEKKIAAKPVIKLTVPKAREGAGFFSWKIRLSGGEKKAVTKSKKLLYLKGSLSGAKLSPEAHFVDDILFIRRNGSEGESSWIGIYEKESLKLIEERITNKTEENFSLPKGKELQVAVARFDKGIKGDFSLIDLPDREKPNAMVRFQEGEVFKKPELTVDLIFTGKCYSTIIVNDKELYKEIEDQGRFHVKLPEGETEVKVHIRAENGNQRNFTKKLYVDSVFPKITLDSEIDGAVTKDESILINGSCDEEAELFLNGTGLRMDENKKFRTDFHLLEGENEIKLVAKDRAGNVTNIRAVVKREMEHEPDIRIVLLVTGTFGVIFLAYFITFIRWLMVKKARKS